MIGNNSRIALHLTLIIFVAALFVFRDPSVVLFVGGVGSLLTYGFLAINEVITSPDVLTPLSYHFLWYGAGFGIASIYFGLTTIVSPYVGFDQIWYVRPLDLAEGYLICLIGSFILHCTLRYVAPDPKQTPARVRIINPLLGAAIFMAGMFVIIAPPSLAIVRGLPASLLRYSPLAILLAISFGSRGRKKYWLKLFAGTVLLVGANMLAFFPYKGGVLQSLFPLTIALWKCSRKMAVAVLCLIPVFYLTIVAPFVTASRFKTQENPVERLADDSSSDQSSNRDNRQFSKLMGRVFDPIEVGFIVSQTRTSGFLSGATMENIEYALIPRFLWPDKPDMSGGKWFTVYLGSASTIEDADTSTAMTPVGELYWNFALPGVIFGSAILYLLYGGLWALAERLGKSKFPGALLFTMAIMSINMGEFSGAIVIVLGIYTLFLPILLWPKLKRFSRGLLGPPPTIPQKLAQG